MTRQANLACCRIELLSDSASMLASIDVLEFQNTFGSQLTLLIIREGYSHT